MTVRTKTGAGILPKGLVKALGKSSAAVLSSACADIGRDGELRRTYLILTTESLYIAVYPPDGQTYFSGRTPRGLPDDDVPFELLSYPLSELSEPKLIHQVVGGLLAVSVSGEETWLCRFSGMRTRDMRSFCDRLARAVAVKGEFDAPEEPPEQEAAYCPKCGQPYPEKGRAVCPRCMVKRTVFLRILRYFSAYKLRVAVMLLCIAASGVLNALWPYLTGTVLYDGVLAKDAALAARFGVDGDYALLLGLLVLAMVLTRLTSQVISVLHGRMTAYIVPGVTARIKNNVFSAMQRLSIQFYSRRQTGGLMQRVNGDANEVMHFFIDGLPYLLLNVVMLCVSAGVMLWLDWRLALAALFLLPPLFIVSIKLLPRLFHAYGRRSRVMRSIYSRLNDSISGARVVKAFGQEDYENRRFSGVNNQVRDAELGVVRNQNRFSAAYTVGRELPALLVWCTGAFIILSSRGAFTYGRLLTFVNYLAMLQGPMVFFSHLFQWWSNSMNAAQRIFEIIDAKPDVTESPSAVRLQLKGDIELRNVSFSYEPNRPALSDVSFHVRPGEMLGIVGRSGAGKSTLVNLISRLFDTESGEILLDGVNIRELSFSSLRGAVAMVSQETYIFIGTVAENIAYAKPGASSFEILRAAAAADAHRFICLLPDGYDTLVGEGGRQLSGGERQRLSIARAILADPRILVLDEATSAVDTETEQAIQASLDRLIKGRTTLSIAHRLSTLRNADRLIVLDQGRLVEQGTHAELMAQKGIYHRLYMLQTKALAMKGAGIMVEKAEQAGRMPEDTIIDDIMEKEKRAAQELTAVRFITSDNARFERTPGGFVSLEFGGVKYPRVAVHRCFPFSDPDRYISVREPEGDGREIGIIEDMDTLDPETRAMLGEQMALRYFSPKIRRVYDIREEYGYSYWDVETDRGACRFTVRMSGGNVYPIGANRYLVNDIDGNRFEIPDLYALSPREIKKLDLFI